MSDRPLGPMFAKARAEGRAVLLPYLMAGIPSLDSSASMFSAMADAGADGFEIGIPYADPLMDGPVIQAAGQAALANGTNLKAGLGIVRAVASSTAKPCIVMTYANVVAHAGLAAFAARAADAGASALIIADLPVDEAAPFAEAASGAGLGLVLFAAPTTSDERLMRVVAEGPPFIYGIAEMGVTGERAAASERAAALAVRVRATTGIPLVLGVGISGPAAARAAASVADGVIVGSALVRRVIEAAGPTAARAALSTAVTDLRAAVVR